MRRHRLCVTSVPFERVTIVKLIADFPSDEPQPQTLLKLSKQGKDHPLELVTVFAEGKSQAGLHPTNTNVSVL